jgi:DHA1 family bicyclomycin/chloramphenicol resistance-like MFS transporter
MLFAFAPAAAPVIGGWIHVMLGWHAVFGFMALYGALLCIATCLMLPETHPKEFRPLLHVITLARTARSILKNAEFLLLAFSMGANFAAMLIFIGAAPAVILDRWHLGETQFAYLFIPVISGLIGGALVSSRMAGRVTYVQQSRAGFVLAVSGSGLMALVSVAQGSPSVLLQQIMIGVTAFGAQMVGTVLSLRMLDLFPMARGSAASVQSCVSIAISALVFGLLSPVLSGSMLSLSEGSLLSALFALLLFRLAQHVSAQDTGNEGSQPRS